MSSSRKRQAAEEEDDVEKDAAEGTTNSSTKRSRRNLKEDEVEDEGEPEGEQRPRVPRSINKAGRQAEAGVIDKVYVENFMCHRKLSIPLCRNVNFIHGQNGSGKSAILAAIQICLGAGARRTHRARNLKDLVRKESASNGAKVQVTLLNQGDDAYKHDIYGDKITVERTISLNGSYNGYKLLDVNGKEQSRSKKELDEMLDQLNIQVENPVAVLDQEEAKKFLTGKAEDKYAFFNKATDLERLDRSYATVQDNLNELDETKANVECSVGPARDNVMKLKAEWEQFKQLEKLEDEISRLRVQFAWSLYRITFEKVEAEEAQIRSIEEKLAKRKQDLEKAVENMNDDDSNEDVIKEKLGELTKEAAAAAEAKKDAESQLKAAQVPIKQHERTLSNLKRDIDAAKNRMKAAVKELQDTRNEYAKKQGSAQSAEAKRTERLNTCESKLREAKDAKSHIAEQVDFFRKKYDETEAAYETAQGSLDKIKRQIHGADKKLQEISASESNNLRLFGEKCPAMASKVDQYVANGRFRGPVLGPIGKYIKVAEGKETLASLAEAAIGKGSLDRFIVTNDADRTLFMKLRAEIGCGPRDCNLFQVSDGGRYQAKEPPEGVDTVSTVLSIMEPLVFNCLIDQTNADQVALMTSKESSERSLLIEGNGRSSIRGNNIKKVFFLPNGDFWQVSKAGSLSIISSSKRLTQTIGLDKTRAIQEAEREIDLLRTELRNADDDFSKVRREREDYRKNWNTHMSKLKNNDADIKKLENDIDDLRGEAEAAVNVTYDTSDLEDEAKAADEAYQALKEKESDCQKAIDELQPAAQALKRSIEEISARNSKIVADINATEKKMEDIVRNQTEKLRSVDKKRAKVDEAENALKQQRAILEDKVKKNDEALSKARTVNWKYKKASAAREETSDGNVLLNADLDGNKEPDLDEIASIEPMKTDREPDFYKNKIQRAEKEVEKEKVKRNLSEKDPEVAYEKYMRAKKDIDSKLQQIEQIKINIESLKKDLKSRRKMWKRFRSHICDMTSNTFDEILNKKGSSGQIEFNHENKELNLTVQKDNRNSMTQTSDVKALSGGERSFTTLSLLLALGESLETPFRVMDEFDVFLDPMSRKIALDSMISVAKSMEHRQFIFITPQDLSSLPTDPQLKIILMKPPERSQLAGRPSQQTLDFASQA